MPTQGFGSMTRDGNMRKHLERLPREIYDLIYDLTIIAPCQRHHPDHIELVGRTWKPPVQLQLCRAIRQQLYTNYYCASFVFNTADVLKWYLSLDKAMVIPHFEQIFFEFSPLPQGHLTVDQMMSEIRSAINHIKNLPVSSGGSTVQRIPDVQRPGVKASFGLRLFPILHQEPGGYMVVIKRGMCVDQVSGITT